MRLKMNEIEVNSKPRRAQGGKGLLSQSIHIQSLHKSMAKIPNSREEKRGTGRRGAPGRGGAALFLHQGKGKKAGEGVRGYLTPTTLNSKD